MEISHPRSRVPEYVYTDPEDPHSLFQGDVIEVTGLFRLRFKKYYPKITHEPYERKFAMVISQSCDLVRRPSVDDKSKLGRPNTSHITVCLIRPLDSVLSRELEFSGANRKSGFYLISTPKYEATLGRVNRLINNSEAKNLFFLPKLSNKIAVDSVAILNVSFAFRASCYDELISKRVASLRSDFRAKVGFLIADYFGRVATGDLLDAGWSQEELIHYSKNVLRKTGVVDAINGKFIGQKHSYKNMHEVDTAIRKFKEQEEINKIEPILKGLRNGTRDYFFELLRDPAKVAVLAAMDDATLRRTITAEIKPIFS